MAAQILSAILAIIVGVGGCVAYFWGANRLLDLIFPSRGVSRRGGDRQSAPAGPDPAVAVHRPGADHPDRLSDLSRSWQTLWLSFHDRTGDNFVGFANYAWAFGDREFRNSIFNNILWLAGGAGRLHLPRPGHRRAHRQDLVGHHRQEPDLPAARHLLRRRQRDLEIHLRVSRRRPDADRPAQRHRPVFRRQPAGLDIAAVLEQFLPDGDPDLDPDRLCHGHPVVGAARHSRGDAGGGGHRRRQPVPDLLEDHGPADLGHDRRGLDHHHHPRAEGLRHRADHDQRPMEQPGACQPDVRLDVPRRRRLRPRRHDRHHHHDRGAADHDLEHPPGEQRRREGTEMAASGNREVLLRPLRRPSSPCLVFVALWTIPTLGILVTSLRDKDQIIASGWWTPSPARSQTRGRPPSAASAQAEKDGKFVIEGNLFGDGPAQRDQRLRHALARQPTKYPAGTRGRTRRRRHACRSTPTAASS